MKRFLSPIAVRLLLFNVLLVFLPVAGLLSLQSLERQLLDLQERSMVQQGRLVAAALSAAPDALRADSARALLQRLGGRSEARVRIVDRGGLVIADSATRGAAPSAASDVEEAYRGADPASRNRLLYRIGAQLWRAAAAVREFFGGPSGWESYSPPPDPTPRDVIAKALAGRYGATLRESAGQRSLTLYSVVPVRAGGSGSVIGAVMVSQSTSRILRALWRVRLDTFEVFALSVVAAVVLSLLMSATIARPLIRLRNEADDLLDHRGRLRRTFGGSKRRDEIGDLTRALERLTARLERHLQFVESFPADVSHEFKNPLASIRTASELLSQTDDPAQREQLATTIDKEVARLSRLLSAVREVSKIDAAVDLEEATPVELRSLLTELRSMESRIDLSLPVQPVVVTVSEDRLVQALRNIVDNALSFSPPDARVRVSVTQDEGHAVLRVDDEGPGIPPEHVERIFDRFFSFRPDPTRRHDHDGLGLAIARSIIEAYGGTIQAMNRTPRGTRIEMRLPVVGG
ncbi:MAG: two-component system, OmpR family, sensor histidine kinase ChvG [Acidobacteriota bacterium]|nr:two-component system, OmpR family, sensor histidine kinase ChvG [Acidobacteriota bacterium]